MAAPAQHPLGEENNPPGPQPAWPRPSLLALGALLAGMAAARGLGAGSSLGGWALAAAALLLAAWGLREGAAPRWRLAALLAGVAAGGWLLQAPLDARDAQARRAVALIDQAPGGLVLVEGTLAREPRPGRSTATLWLEPGARLSRGGREAVVPGPIALRVRLPEGSLAPLESVAAGDAVRSLGRLRPVAPFASPGDLDAWLASQGAAAQVDAATWSHAPPAGGRSALATWRFTMRRAADRMEARLLDAMPLEQAAVACAMTLGRTRWLSDAQREACARSGLLHLFAVSGLHAGIVAMLLAGAVRLTGLGPWPRALVIALGLALFAALTGFRSSVLRASLLVAIFTCQPLLRRNVEPMGALATVALALIALGPRSPWQLDFQLSFLCAATIAVASPGAIAIEEWAGRVARFQWWAGPLQHAAQVCFVTACIQVATAPFTVSSFGIFSLSAPLANVLALPLAPFILGGSLVGGAVALVLPGMGGMVAGLVAIPATLLDWSAAAVAALPLSAVEPLPAWPAWLAGGYYALVLVALRGRRGATFDVGPAGRIDYRRGLLAAVLVLLLQPMLSVAPGPMLRVDFIDVGQGDAILLRARGGATVLVDAGPPRGSALADDLRVLGARDLDLLVLTHADADHIGGAPAVIERLRPTQVAGATLAADTEVFRDVDAALAAAGTPRLLLRRGDHFRLSPEVIVDVLHPAADFLEEGDDRNDSSIVLRVQARGVVLLLAGDAEAEAERDMVSQFGPEFLRADVLKAGHHGSASSTGAAFLAAVQPTHAVLSAGRDNRYGHPSPAVLARLAEWGVAAWRTDKLGTITMETDGARVTWRAERPAAAAPPP